MALSASSVLHWWSARYGEIPTFGGYPVFTRNTAAKILDRSGKLITAPPNSPRFGWNTISGEKRQTLRLEQARTNVLLYSSDFSNAAWTKSATMSVATGVSDPMGGTSACTLSTSAGGDGNADQTLSASTSIQRTNSVWLRRRSGSGTISIVNPGSGAWQAVAITDKWQRYSIVGVAGVYREMGIRIHTALESVDVWCAQNEDGACMTSEIQTTSAAVTRSTDSLYFDYQPIPQAGIYYSRHIERGTLALNSWLYSITDASRNFPLIRVNASAAGGYYAAYHNNNGGSISSAALAVAPAIGDLVELLFVLNTNGHVDIVQSINGAAVTSATDATAATLAAAWAAPRLYVNGGGTDTFGVSESADIRAVMYADVVASTAQGRMDELRALEFDGQGNQL